MKKYYCDNCGKEMTRHHIVEIKFTGKERDKEYEKELCNDCFIKFLADNKMKE